MIQTYYVPACRCTPAVIMRGVTTSTEVEIRQNEDPRGQDVTEAFLATTRVELGVICATCGQLWDAKTRQIDG